MKESQDTLRILLQRAKFLRVEVDKVDPDPQRTGSGRSGSGLSAFTKPFNTLLRNVRTELSNDQTALDQLSTVEEVGQLDELQHPAIHRQRKHDILIGCREIEVVLEGRLSPSVEVPSMKVTREGVFFAGQPFSAIQWITDILLSAKRSIMIVDNYIDQKVLRLLEGKGPTVTSDYNQIRFWPAPGRRRSVQQGAWRSLY